MAAHIPHLARRNLALPVFAKASTALAGAGIGATLAAPMFAKRRRSRARDNDDDIEVIHPDDVDEKLELSPVEVNVDNPYERCRRCNGNGTIPCGACQGLGTLRPGGFHYRRNHVRLTSLVGSKWTSTTAIAGKWRHFLCTAKRGSNTKNGSATMSSTCGPVSDRVALNIPISDLKSREKWQAGWTTLTDIRAEGGSNDGRIGVTGGTACTGCKGSAVVICDACEGLGQLGL